MFISLIGVHLVVTCSDDLIQASSARVVDALVDAGIETYDTRYYPNKVRAIVFDPPFGLLRGTSRTTRWQDTILGRIYISA